VEYSDEDTLALSEIEIWGIADTTPPSNPTGLSKFSPSGSSGNSLPSLRVTGLTSGDIIKIYSGDSCASEIRSVSATGTTMDIAPLTLADGAYTDFSTKAFDHAGNSSACITAEINYTLDTVAPTNPSGLTKASPSSALGTTIPTFTVAGVTSGDTLKLYSGNNCATELKSGTASGTTLNLTPGSMDDGAYSTFGAKAFDPVGNASACISASISYTLDRVAPSAPSGLSFSSSSGTDATPTLTVTGISSGTTSLEVFSDSSCTTNVGTATVSGTSASITLDSLPQGSSTLRVKASDSAGNRSSCSNSPTTSYTLSALSNVQISSSAMNNPNNLVDGSISSGTSISYENLPATLEFEFSGVYSIDSIVLTTDWWSKRPKSGEIKKWNGSSWETVKTFNIPSAGGTDLTCGDGTTTFGGVQCAYPSYPHSFHKITGFSVTTDKIRLVINETWSSGNGSYSIYNEVQFFGTYQPP
jgi:hypothetical protein